MKFLLVLTCACAILANVNSKLSVTKIDFDELKAKAEDILISNPKLEDEIQFLKNQIEIVREIQVKPLNPKLKRRKRQTTSINCTALCIELTTIQSDIALTKIRITNSSITLNGLAIQLKKYEEKVSNTTGSTQKTLEDLTRITRLYKNLVTSINSTLETLKKNLVILQANETKTKFDIDTFCVALDPAKYPCGTFIPYDPNNGKTHPNVNGFAGGINLDGSTAFIGYGNASSCSNQLLAPCSLRTNGNSPGCNIPCGSNQIIDGKNSFYLLNNQNLAWVPTDVTNMLNVLNSLKLLGPNNFMFGRANVDGNYILGKVHAGNGISAFQALTSNGQFQLTTGFEILTCLVVNSCSCSGQYLGSTVIPSNPITNPPTAAPTVPPNPITNPPTEVPTVPPNPITNPPTEVPTVPPNPITNPPTEVPTVPPNPINNPPTAAPTVPPNPITNPPTEVPTVPPNQITNPPTEVPTVPPNPITNPPTAAPTVPPNPITNPPTEVPTVPPNPITNPPTAAPTVPPTVSSNNVLSSGSSFKFGQTITGTDGSYLTLSNGDLVYFNNAGNVIWQAGVSEGSSVVMNSDGTLTILDANGNSIWTVNGTPGSSLQIQNGQVFLVNGGAVSWASSSSVTMAPTIAPTNPTFDPSSYPCATFTNYDSINSRTAPELYGFVGGTNYDQTSPQYVGYGNNPCGNPLQTACPGYINTISNPGIYMSCENGLQFDNTEVYFLLNHSNLQWVDTDSANLFLVSKRIYVNDTSNHFYFGRVFYNGQYRLGKVHGSSPGIGFFVVDQFNNELSYSNGFQILTCGSSNQGSTISPTLAPTEVITPTLTPTTNVPIGNSLSSGGSFTSGQSITGSDGSYLALHNGDLVYYDSTGNIIWNAGITGGSYVGLNSDGTLSVSDSNNNSIWLINGAPGSTLSIQNGEVVLVKGGSIVWSSLSGSSNSQTTESPSIDNTLSSGSSFTSGQRYYGSDGSYFALVDGDFVYYDSAGQIAWRAGVSGGSYIAMGSDGSLSVYDVDGHELWSVYGTPGSSLSIQNGELVLMYGGSTIWGSSSGYSSSSGSISSGSSFTSGQRYYGSDGSYFALVDGDFVYYDSAGQIAWRAGVSGGSYIAMGSDGSLSVYDVDGHELWSVYGTPGSSLSIQNGELVLMYGGSTIWGSSSGYSSSSGSISSGSSFTSGQRYYGSDGSYFALVDGDFVYYDSAGQIAWRAGVSGGSYIAMGSDGSLSVYDVDGHELWSVYGTPGSSLSIQNGELVLMYGGSTIWGSSSGYSSSSGSISSGSSFTSGQRYYGSDGSYFALVDGDFVYYDSAGQIAWRAGVSGGSYIAMGSDGSLSVYDVDGHELWSVYGTPGSSLSIQNGELVLMYGGSTIWGSSSGYSSSSGSISSGSSFTSGQRYYGSDGSYFALVDGDFVYYDSAGQIAWRAGVSGGSYIAMGSDGSLSVYDVDGHELWSVYGTPGSSLSIQNGELVLMYGGSTIWGSSSGYSSSSGSISSGSSFTSGQRYYGSDGSYFALVDGDFVYYDSAGQIVWRAGVSGGSYIAMGSDGSLSVYDVDGYELWSVYGTPGSSLSIQNGELVLMYGGSTIWGSSSGYTAMSSRFIISGDSLYRGGSRISSNGQYQLIFQSDGNLVIKSVLTGKITWSTYTAGSGATRVTMNSDGNLVMYDNNYNIIWSSGSSFAGSNAMIRYDGSLVVYSGQDIFWDSSPKQIANGCGSLIYFDIYNNSLIESIGFTGGIFTDGSVAYAGIADNIACNQQYCPARISTISNAPGGYMSCGTSQYDSAYAYFIRAHSNLYWIPTDTANMKYVWGRLEVNSSTDSFMVGRKTMDNNFSQISKIHNGPGFSFNFIDTNNQESAVQNDFDILVCDSSPACGTYVYYDTKNQPNAPLTNGYIGGIAKDGSIAFVGRGNNAVQNQNPCPARISAYPNSAGAYMPAGTETYDTNSAYYILDHPDLHWVSTDVYNMNNVYGALHLTAGSFAFSHGRVMINNYAYLGKIHDGSSFNYIDDNGQESGLSSGFEILVCDSSLTTQMRTCNNTIQAGTCLYPGESIWSCSGCFILSFQVDNNLVVYSKSGAIIWSTATHYQGPVRACIESDGHFNLYNSNNAVQWSTPWFVANTDTQAVATILDDGQFVVVAGGQTKFTSGITAVCEI